MYPHAALALFLVFLSGCGTRPTGPVDQSPVVVLISMDGFRYDYAGRVDTPGFDRMAREGAKADRLIPPFPSQTFPSHATLATGVTTDRHGIVNNKFKDRKLGAFAYGNEARWYDAVPLWIHATQHGLKTFVFHWVGSKGPYKGVEPAQARVFDKSVSDDTKVETLLDWLQAPQHPRLVMSYFQGCDHAGHEQGPDSEAVSQCVVESDARITQLIEGFAKLPFPVNLLVVSDHGMMKTVGAIDVRAELETLNFGIDIQASGPIAHLFVAPKHQAEALAFTQKIKHLKAWTPETLPKTLHYVHPQRTGDLILIADYGWRFDSRKDVVLPGHHGHDPNRPEMGAIFYAWGPGIKAGSRMAMPKAVDIVPTVCRLLGIAPPTGIDGQARTEILK